MIDRRIDPISQIPILKSLLCLFITLLTLSCNEHPAYIEYQTIEHSTWQKEKEYSFSFEVSDRSIPYDVFLDIRSTHLYPYQNLWISFTESLNEEVVKRDTIEFQLANEKGNWKGNGISLFHTSYPLKTNYRFSSEEEYTYSFQQIMRNEHLKGIQDIGVRIEKSSN